MSSLPVRPPCKSQSHQGSWPSKPSTSPQLGTAGSWATRGAVTWEWSCVTYPPSYSLDYLHYSPDILVETLNVYVLGAL